jgi:hypothetical protein
LVGCVWIQNWVSDGLSLQNGTTQGNIPVGIAPGDPQQLLFFAEQYDEGADWWATALGPDERNWLLTVRDDVNDRTGRYTGCAESTDPSQQGAPQFVCLPSWSGSDSDPTTGFTFEPSSSAPVVAAGQSCATSSASFSDTTDCATSSSDGNISPVPIVGDVMVDLEIVNTGNNAAAISIGPGGYGQDWCDVGPPPDSETCDLSSNSIAGDINIWPANGQTGTPVSIEVTGVSYGLYALNPPTELPTGDIVHKSLTPGQVLSAGQAINAGPYRVVMRDDGELSEYLREGIGAYRVFGSGTSVPGSSAVVARDGSLAVKSPAGRKLWSSKRPAATTVGNLVTYSRAHGGLWVSTGDITGAYATHANRGAVTLPVGHGIPAGGHVAVGAYRLTMRSDGDLVLTDRGRLRWQSRTRGHPGAYLLVRSDGNAVINSLYRHVLWSSHTGGHRDERLRLRARDGRLMVIAPGGQTVWSRR